MKPPAQREAVRTRTPSALVALAALLCVAPAASPAGPVLDRLGPSLDLSSRLESFAEAIWLDVDADGVADPLLLQGLEPSGQNWAHRVQVGPAGAASLVPLQLEEGDYSRMSFAAEMTAQPIDVDGDGQEELLVYADGQGLLLSVGEGGLLTPVDTVLPALPTGLVSDMAVADLDRDGRADVVLATRLDAPERYRSGGRPDLVLMNRGDARFDLQLLEPAADTSNRGLTLADMDGDGLVDIVESVDRSIYYGFSRILLNRSAPGDPSPTFEEAPHVYDVGTMGMGAAVADVDGDGLPDVYNSSIGLDLMALQQPDGSFVDATHDLGFLHEFGPGELRTQWSPVFVDLDLDGRLDLFVRHGSVVTGALAGRAATVTAHAADLVYVKQPSGAFERAPVPFDPAGPTRGRQATVGDLDSDGVPDLLLAGLEGSHDAWRNETPTEGRRVLAVHLVATASGSPTGARVVATCGGEALTRVLTSGGLMGAASARELYFAWPGCEADVDVVVTWPSGASSSLSAGDQTRLTVVEAASGAPPAVEWSPWHLVVNPSLPRPGEDFTVHVLTSPAARTPPEDLTLLVEGQPVDLDGSAAHLEATTPCPFGTDPMTIELHDDGGALSTWEVERGWLLDPTHLQETVYPTRDPTSPSPSPDWEVRLTPVADYLSSDAANLVQVLLPGGAELPVSVVGDTRLRVRVGWDALSDATEVLLTDGALTLPFPVFQAVDDDALMELAQGIDGGVIRSRVAENGDLAPLMFAVTDADDNLLPYPQHLLGLAVDGGEILSFPEVAWPQYDSRMMLRTDPGVGPITVEFYTAKGLLLGVVTSDRRALNPRPFAPELSQLSLDEQESAAAGGSFLMFRVKPVDVFGDAMGPDARPQVTVTHGDLVAQPTMVALSGEWSFAILRSPYEGTVEVHVTVGGTTLGTLGVPVDGPPAPPEDAVVMRPIERHAAITVPAEPPVSPGESSCRASGTELPLPLGLLCLAVMFGLGRRRTARGA